MGSVSTLKTSIPDTFETKDWPDDTSVGLLVLTFCVILSEITGVVRRGSDHWLISAAPGVEVGGFLEPKSSKPARHT